MTEFVPHPQSASRSTSESTLIDEHTPAKGSLTARVGLASAGSFALAACGGGGDSSSSPTAPPVVTSQGITTTQASRFLSQAAIGYSKADVLNLSDSGINRWLDGQFTVLRTQKFWDFLIANGYDAAANINTVNGFDPMVWSQLMGSGDLLRQRVGLALLDQWVVGVDGFGGSWRAFAVAAYLDVLWDNAFGNYRDLMEGVSTSAAMAPVPDLPWQHKIQPSDRVDPR